MRRLAASLCGALLLAGCADLLDPSGSDALAERGRRYPVVPAPLALRPRAGEFRLDARTRLVLSHPGDPAVVSVAELLAEPLRRASGLPLPRSAAPARPAEDNAIVLRLAPLPGTSPERYRLAVSDGGAVLTAAEPVGLFRGTQTLRQLLPAALEEGVRAGAPWSGLAPAAAAGGRTRWAVPAVEIEDAPRFAYRGMHLDVSRHFLPPEFVKKYVDLLALYKLNHFHWHLTDDQGWRLEIRSRPRLTGVGAWRRETVLGANLAPYVGDGVPHGGYYTQEQVREIVAYAAARHIVVVPEIEMPGHSRAAIAAYPELSCPGEPLEVATSWGIFPDVLCPGEESFRFLDDVLGEVAALFPGELVHLGGDEVRTEQWAASPVAREAARREGLPVEGLGGYFLRRAAAMLAARGKRPVGWDEVAEGELPPGTVVMAWRGAPPAVEAARRGHDVVMAPMAYTYFNLYQGDPAREPLSAGPAIVPLDVVYGFEPVPPELEGGLAGRVLGTQGNVWTEYIPTPERVEYMAFPRVLALAEAAWSPRDVRSWKGFQARLPSQLRRLDGLGVRYRAP